MLGTLGLMFLADLPNEIVRWKHAAAIVARDAGEKQRAYELLEKAYGGRTSDSDYQRTAIVWLASDGKEAEALKHLDRLIEANPKSLGFIDTRSSLNLALRRYAEAIADCLEIDRVSEATGKPTRAQSLNQLAYARALAGQDLEQAERDIEVSVQSARLNEEKAGRAWRESQKSGWSAIDSGLPFAAAQHALASYLDTRGFVRYKLGKLDEAKADLDEAIRRLGDYERLRHLYDRRGSRSERYFSTYLAKRAIENRTTAVLYYHRYLIHQKLGEEKAAQRDFQQARSLLGKDPDESVF
jgi:tetratricopeptide (TPR) repeat protein